MGRTKQQIGKGSKAKGSNFENKLAKMIRETFIPEGVDSKVAYNLVHRTSMSGGRTERGDLIIQPPVLQYFPWFIEARNRQTWSWEQIFKNPQENTIVKWYFKDAQGKCHPYAGKHSRQPMLVFTKNNDGIYCCIDGIDFVNLIHTSAHTFSFKLSLDMGAVGNLIILSFEEVLKCKSKLDISMFDGLEFK